MKTTVLIPAALVLVLATSSAEAALVGVPTGQHARVMNDIYSTQQRNAAAIAHVRRSIAATRRQAF